MSSRRGHSRPSWTSPRCVVTSRGCGTVESVEVDSKISGVESARRCNCRWTPGMARGLVVALFGCDRSLCRFRVSLSNKIPGSVVLMAVVFWLRVRRWTIGDGRWETVERKGKGRSAGEIGLGGVGSRQTCEREMRRTRADMHADCPSNGTGGMKNGAGVGEARSGKAPVSWQTVNGVDSTNPSHLDDIFHISSSALMSATWPSPSACALETLC